MEKEKRRKEAQQFILPVFLGNTKLAHTLSARMFHRYGVMSLILGTPHLRDLLDINSKIVRLSKNTHPRRIAERLVGLVSDYPDTLPVLVPCSTDAEALLAEYSSLLEPQFILTDPQTLFSVPPLSDF